MASNVRIWLRERFATAPAIYGLIVFEVLIGATSDEPGISPLVVLFWSGLAFLAFYIAHAFAEVVARHGDDDLRTAIRHGFVHSVGMLYSAILPTLAILICAAAGLSGETAADAALIVGLVVLAVLGFIATMRRRKRVWAGIIGGLVTAFLGLVVMIIELLVH